MGEREAAGTAAFPGRRNECAALRGGGRARMNSWRCVGGRAGMNSWRYVDSRRSELTALRGGKSSGLGVGGGGGVGGWARRGSRRGDCAGRPRRSELTALRGWKSCGLGWVEAVGRWGWGGWPPRGRAEMNSRRCGGGRAGMNSRRCLEGSPADSGGNVVHRERREGGTAGGLNGSGSRERTSEGIS